MSDSNNGHDGNGNGKLRAAKVKKVTIVGGGAIGKEVLRDICEEGLALEVTVWNRTEEENKKPKELAEIDCFMKALDQKLIVQGKQTPLLNFKSGPKKLGDALEGADVVVVTAGAKREEAKPGHKEKSREDLLNENRGFIEELAKHAGRAPNASWILAPNPLDTLTQSFQEKSGVNADRVVGISSDLDSARFVQAISLQFGIPRGEEDEKTGKIREVIKDAHIIGEHGPTMVPVMSKVRIQLNANDAEVSLQEYAERFVQTNEGRGKVAEVLRSYETARNKIQATINDAPKVKEELELAIKNAPDELEKLKTPMRDAAVSGDVEALEKSLKKFKEYQDTLSANIAKLEGFPEKLKADEAKLVEVNKILKSWEDAPEQARATKILLDDIAQTTIKGGEYFVLKQGYSDYIAPGAAVSEIVSEIIHSKAYPDKEKKRIFCSALREGKVELGAKPVVYMGGPVEFDGEGRHKIVPLLELGMNAKEKSLYEESAALGETKMAGLDKREGKPVRELQLAQGKSR